MATARDATATRHVRTLFDVGTMAGLADAQLLGRFLHRNGEAAELAFAALVERHGPMVLRVCRRVLNDPHDAHDAFQATFLVLVTRAGSLRSRDSLASWLHGVAVRVARCSRAAAMRRRSHESRKAQASATSFEQEVDDLGPLVHEEFLRLPERYRAPMALCDLEDLTHEQAARQLGWPVGTVKSRLARGRRRLRERLTRRGVAPAVPILSVSGGALRGVPDALVDDLARAAVEVMAGSPMAGVVPAATAALVQGVRRMLIKESIRVWMLAGMALGLVAVGVAIAAQEPSPPRPVPARAKKIAARVEEERQVSCEVRFALIDALDWREKAGSKLKVVSFRAPFTVWTADPKALGELLNDLSGRPRTNVVQAPKVTTFEDAPAFIHNGTMKKLNIPDAKATGRVVDAMVGLANHEQIGKGVTVPLDGPEPRSEEIPDGLVVKMTGKQVEKGMLVRALIVNSHVIALHDVTLPGSRATDPSHPEAGAKPMRVKLPEVVQSRIEGEWMLAEPRPGEQESLVVSLGPERVVNDKGEAKVSERLVVLTPRHVLLESEEERIAPPKP